MWSKLAVSEFGGTCASYRSVIVDTERLVCRTSRLVGQCSQCAAKVSCRSESWSRLPGLPRAPTWVVRHVWCSTKVTLWCWVLCRFGQAGRGSGAGPKSMSGNVTDGVRCKYWQVSFSLLRGADFKAIFRPQNLDHVRGSFVIVIEAADEYDPKTVLFFGVCVS